MESLRTSVRLGAHTIDLWLAERFADADVFAGNGGLHRSLRRIGDAAPKVVSDDELLFSLDAIRQRYSYRSAAVLDTMEGIAVKASGVFPSTQDIESAQAATTRVRWVELTPRSAAGEYRAAVVRRISENGPLARYTVFLEVDPQQLVKTLVRARSDDLQSSSVLMRRKDDEVLRLEPARDPGGNLLAFSTASDRNSVEFRLLTSSSAQMKAAGVNGRPVMAAREALSLPGWYLIGTVDESSVLSALHNQTRMAVVAYAVLLAAVAAVLARWLRSERSRQTEREANVVQFYDKILRQGNAMFTLTDWRGKIIDASEVALQSFGYSREELVGRDIMDLVPERGREDVLKMVRGMSVGETRAFSAERVRADGSSFFMEGSVGLLEIRGRRYFHSVGRDVTREREVSTRLQLAASVFDLAPAAIVVADKSLTVLSVNPAFTSITGFTSAEVVGILVHSLATGDVPSRTEEIFERVRTGTFWEGEIYGRRKNGEVYPRRMLAAAHWNADGEIDQYIGIFTDLTRLKQAEVMAEFHANHDPITQLPSRRKLDQVLPEQVSRAQASGKSVTLAIFNVDRFKTVNDSFGLAEGDQLLATMAVRLKEALPVADLYHFAADEFVVLLDGPPVGHALTIDRALALVCAKMTVGHHTLALSVSVGLASYPELADGSSSLLKNAGAALRTAKSRGGRAWQLYEPSMNATAFEDMLLAVDLRAALDDGQLELHFQPQATMSDWTLVGMEALLRWKHPTRGAVPPSRFIPVAEASGLIDDLSRWVLNEACRIWAIWRDEGLQPPPVAVNVSALQFKHQDFVTDISRTVARYDIRPDCLVLELTESLIMDNSESAISTMHRVTAMGVRLALDDFGTGYSSLSYLTRLPLDKLKIDRSFILNIGSSKGKEGEAIVKSVILMAQALNLRVVAEGVEQQEHAEFLRTHGCDEVQGYLFSVPLCAADFRGLLASTLEARKIAAARFQRSA